ncbi:Gfo/Idh/MocA family protein [Nonomuraea sp. NPDC050394]|uniref:Gfo/Idh/MocA family protein n=1 Tax=Nonomuraea sp. NPDC050394 TaxID=3364363 RepID=UPI0037AC2069
MRFGVIGCGDIGVKDAEAVAAADDIDLVACLDPVNALADDIATRFGARAERTLEEMLSRTDLDAVIIATPHDTHEQVALAALAAGKHVLLEKPLAHDLGSARRIAAAAAGAGTTVSVLFPLRADPRFRRARTAVRQGRIGTPLGAAASYAVHKPTSYFRGGFSQRAISSWRLSKARAGGGFLIMNVIHHVDAIRSLLDAECDSVYAEMAPSAIAPEVEDTVAVILRFGQVVATLTGGASVPGGDGQRLHLWGAAGQVRVLPDHAVTSAGEIPPVEPPRAGADPRVTAISRFAAAARDGAAPDVTVRDALAVQAIVTAAYRSASLRHAVRPAELLGEAAAR